jgi:transposase
MHSTTVAVDLAKNVFELAVADAEGKIGERLRLNRARFSSFFVHRAPCRVLMEACGSAHYWARRIAGYGHEVRLLPAQYVRQYVRRNKTDRADAAALIEAARCTAIRTVPAKSLEQQQVLVLHRLRSQWMSTRHRYLNTLRGLLREFGIAVPLGVRVARARIAHYLAQPPQELPAAIRPLLAQMLSEVKELEHRIEQIERELTALTRADPVVQQLRQIPGIGLLSSTAIRAAVGDVERFPCGRSFASWLGLTRWHLQAGRCLFAHPTGPRRPLCTPGCASTATDRASLGSPQTVGPAVRTRARAQRRDRSARQPPGTHPLGHLETRTSLRR